MLAVWNFKISNYLFCFFIISNTNLENESIRRDQRKTISKKCIKRRITYMVSHLFRTKLQGLIEDVNWNNFNHKQFSCENIDIFEKKNCGFFF